MDARKLSRFQHIIKSLGILFTSANTLHIIEYTDIRLEITFFALMEKRTYKYYVYTYTH